MNKIKFVIIILSLLNVSSCSLAKKNEINHIYKKYESKSIMCGSNTVKVVSSCFDPEEGLIDRGSGGIVRECKGSELIIGKNKINLPIGEINKKNEKILREGLLSLISFSCFSNKNESFILLNQGFSNNINYSHENSDDNLTIILNIKGGVEKGKEYVLKDKKYRISKIIPANAVYGVN